MSKAQHLTLFERQQDLGLTVGNDTVSYTTYTKSDYKENQDPVVVDSGHMHYVYADESNVTIKIPLSNYYDPDGDKLSFKIENWSPTSRPTLNLKVTKDHLVITGDFKDQKNKEYNNYWIEIEDGKGGRTYDNVAIVLGIREEEQTSAPDEIIIGKEGGDKIQIGVGDTGYGRDGNDRLSLEVTDEHRQDIISFEEESEFFRYGEDSVKFNGGGGDDTYIVEKGQSVSIYDTDGNNRLVLGEGLRKEDLRFKTVDGIFVITFKNSRTSIEAVAGSWTGESSFSRMFSEIEFANGDILTPEEFGVIDDLTATPMGNNIIELTAEKEFSVVTKTIANLHGHHVIDVGGDPDLRSYKITKVSLDGKTLPDWLHYDYDTDTLTGTGPKGYGQFILTYETVDDKGNVGYFDKFFQIGGSGQDNRAPIIDDWLLDSEVNGQEGQKFTYQFDAAAFTDPDFDKLDYSVTLADGSALPNWLNFDQKTLTLTGVVPKGADDLSLKIIVTDTGNLSDSFNFNVLIEKGISSNEIVINPDEKFGQGTDGDDLIIGHDNGGTIHAGKGDDEIHGGKENDRIFGQEGNNTLIGGKGDDYLSGGDGDNLYIFSKGDGNDTVFASKRKNIDSTDIIKFTDVAFADAKFRGENYDLIIEYGDSDSIRIEGFFTSQHNHLINEIQFSDKTITLSDLKNIEIPIQMIGDKNGMNYFLSLNWDGKLTIATSDLGGRVTLTNGENNYVTGGKGNDRFMGSTGNDTLIGGQGDDYLMGGFGSDTYIFSVGDGNDTINNYAHNDRDAVDTIQFTDVKSADVTFSRNQQDLIISYGNNDSINVKNYFNGQDYKVNQFTFSDKVTLSSQEVEGLIKKQKELTFAVADQLPVTDTQELSSLLSAMASFGAGGNGAITTDLNDNQNSLSLASYLVTSSC